MNHRTTLLAAAVLGATGVGLGAFGAHALRDFLLERGMTSAWETGARYQLLHAVALVGLAAAMGNSQSVAQRWLSRVSTCWVVGTVLFSGSLYLLTASGLRWLGPVTPIGGLVLLAGWLGLIGAALAKEK